MNLDKINYKNFEVNNHNQFISKLKKIRETNRLIDNNEQWLDNDLSPYSLGYIKEEKPIKISIWKIGKGRSSYLTYGWNLI